MLAAKGTVIFKDMSKGAVQPLIWIVRSALEAHL